MLRGAFTIGTPDAITHLAEELPHPKKDLSKAIGLQVGLSFLCLSTIAIFHEVQCAWKSLGRYMSFRYILLRHRPTAYPLAGIYLQATTDAYGHPNNRATSGLLLSGWHPSCVASAPYSPTRASTALWLVIMPYRSRLYLAMSQRSLAAPSLRLSSPVGEAFELHSIPPGPSDVIPSFSNT